MIVYADIVFLANFISSTALFFLYGAIIKAKLSVWKIVAAAALSGVFAVCEALWVLPYVLRTPLLLCMVWIVLGKESLLFNAVRLMLTIAGLELVFVFIIAQFGYDGYIANGTVTVFANSVFGFFVYALSYPFLLLFRFITDARARLRRVRVIAGGREKSLVLLYDSGNLLKHNGLPVAVVSKSAIEFINTDGCIEFSALGGGGLLPVIKPETCVIDGIERDIYIAVSDRRFNGVDGIIGKF